MRIIQKISGVAAGTLVVGSLTISGVVICPEQIECPSENDIAEAIATAINRNADPTSEAPRMEITAGSTSGRRVPLAGASSSISGGSASLTVS